MYIYIYIYTIPYLPIGHKNNTLNDDEFWNGIKGLEQIPACHVKQGQSIECQTVRNGVYNGEI